MTATPNEILQLLRRVRYPGYSRDIVSFGMVKDIKVGDSDIAVELRVNTPDPHISHAIVQEVEHLIENAIPGAKVRVLMERSEATELKRQTAQTIKSRPAGVRHVIAIASGKGGVGKSTVAVNLALAVKNYGARVGLMDADVYGPSIAMMLGATGTVEVTPERKILPLTSYGIRYVSMALFVNDQTPVIWRGPMVTKLELEFLFNVQWSDLDLLVIDLPPGTGDAQLTITQRVLLDGGIIVTTPQDVALLDVRRGVSMFRDVGVPVLGVVENMSYYHCRKCGRRHKIFGHKGGMRLAQGMDLEFLGDIPIIPSLCAGADQAKPIVAMDPYSKAGQVFHRIASLLMKQLGIAAAESAQADNK